MTRKIPRKASTTSFGMLASIKYIINWYTNWCYDSQEFLIVLNVYRYFLPSGIIMSKLQKTIKPITPEKQEYLDRCAKRQKALSKIESRRKKRKIGIKFTPLDGDAPCAYMVEHVKKEAINDTVRHQTDQQTVSPS
jgi:hypothetical protein